MITLNCDLDQGDDLTWDGIGGPFWDLCILRISRGVARQAVAQTEFIYRAGWSASYGTYSK